MNAAAHPALRMLHVAWQWRRNDGSLWALRLYALVLAVLFGGPAIAALWWMTPRAAWLSVSGLALTGLCLVWSAHFAVLLRLDHPQAAHTVPGYARGLRMAAVGLWAALVALCALAAGWGAGLGAGVDAEVPAAAGASAAVGWHTGLAVAAGTGALLLLLAAALRWWGLWVLVSVVPSFMGVPAWRRLLFSTAGWVQQIWLAQPLAVTVALLMGQALLLAALFGKGNGAHARAYAQRERTRRAFALGATGQPPALAAYGRWGEWLSLPTQMLGNAWQRRCVARARPRLASVMDRAELLLHGCQHWVRQLAVLLLVQLCVGAAIVLTAKLTGAGIPRFLEHGRLGISIGLSFMAINAVLNLPRALWASRREQALLMLLPGMPQGAALNRALAWRQWRHCLVLWLALSPALGLVLWAGLAPHALAFLGLALPLSAWLWRDHSRMQAGRPLVAFMLMAACASVGVLSMFLLSRHPAAFWPWALCVLGLAAALLAWRWRLLARLPQALPVGRLA